jgi:hypothetical protein
MDTLASKKRQFAILCPLKNAKGIEKCPTKHGILLKPIGNQ